MNIIPILKLDNCLIVSVQVELDDSKALTLQQSLISKLHETNARGVLIDLTALEFIDSFIARIINEIVHMTKLMGAKVVVTGIQPAIAITLVELGIYLDQVATATDLQSGLRNLQKDLEV